MPRRTVRPALTLAVAMFLALVAGAAPAGASTSQTASGQIILYQNTNFTGTVSIHAYSGCVAPVTIAVGQVGSYDNRPPAGCVAVLVNRAGAAHQLCAGRAVVPVDFRHGPRLRIQSGTSRPCGLLPVR